MPHNPGLARIADQEYLRSAQYQTPAKLSARADLHRRFSTNAYGWMRWVFDQLALPPGARVLEVGGGPGFLWRENLDRLPHDLHVSCSDFSLGMVREAHNTLASDGAFTCVNLDVQAIAFPPAQFDVVVANHMLYHVPDLPHAVREIARVLGPGARLCAATNGLRHMQELAALVNEFELQHAAPPDMFARRFGLENAPEILGQAFSPIEVRHYQDALWVTEAKPLTDYVLSLSGLGRFGALGPERAAELHAFFEKRIAAEGGIHIGKQAGLVMAVKP